MIKLHQLTLPIARAFHSSAIVSSASQSPLFQLRQRTGLAYNLCREALNKHNNNIDEAECWLKAQALAHGLQKATKVRGRNAKEGLIGLAVHRGNKLATFLELNCETDFVAKNQLFKDLAVSLTEQLASDTKGCEAINIPDQAHIRKLKPREELFKSIDTQIVPLITRLGEHIKVQRAFHFESTEDEAQVFCQIHSKSAEKITDSLDIKTGRYGAVVALKTPGKSHKDKTISYNPIGNRLCQHVIGYSPSYIELPENMRKHLEAIEKEAAEKAASESVAVEEDGDSDSEGSSSPNNSRDDWPSIMDQQLIMSDDTSVREFCKENEVSIVYFDRFECGQSS